MLCRNIFDFIVGILVVIDTWYPPVLWDILWDVHCFDSGRIYECLLPHLPYQCKLPVW